jgi:acyl-CoA-dependent ceramide synthase
LILRILWRFVRSSVVKDERSEDEDDDEEVVEEAEKEKLVHTLIPSVELNGEAIVGATGKDVSVAASDTGLKKRG